MPNHWHRAALIADHQPTTRAALLAVARYWLDVARAERLAGHRGGARCYLSRALTYHRLGAVQRGTE